MAFQTGILVYHGTFGSGEVLAVDGERYIIRFSVFGVRKVQLAELREHSVEGVKDAKKQREKKPVEPLARGVSTVNASSLAGQEIPPREWHVPDLIPAGTVTILGGDGGTGKSLLATQLAVATAMRHKWVGLDVASGPTLYLSAEDDLAELHRRLAVIAVESHVDLADMTELDIVPLAGEDALLAIPDGRGAVLKPTGLFQAIEARISRDRPALVVLDTLADLFGGQENDRAQVRQFVGLLRGWAIKHQATIVMLAHPSLSGMTSGTGASGSTAWTNSVRSRLYLERELMSEGGKAFEPDADIRILRNVKSNYARAGASLRLRWERGVLVPLDNAGLHSDGITRASEARKADALFVTLTGIYHAEGRPVNAKPGPNYAPKVFAEDPRANGLTNHHFREAMSRMLSSGRVKVEEYGPPSHRRNRLVAVNRAEPKPDDDD